MSACLRLIVLAALGLQGLTSATAGVVASYGFQGTLAADQPTAPALVAIDPLGLSGFETATVHGVSQTVYRFSGNGDDPTHNAGLSLATAGLVDPQRYVVSMTFEFFSPAVFGSGWIRVLDTEARSSDNGLYVSPQSTLPPAVITVVQQTEINSSGDVHMGGRSLAFQSFHDLVLSVVPGPTTGTQLINIWIDGQHDIVDVATSRFSLDNVNNPNRLLGLFADNLATAQAPLEYASGRIASLTLSDTLPVPEPSPALLLAGGLLALGLRRSMANRARTA